MTHAIIFDCDGVLVDSEVLALEVELSALAGIGLPYERAAFQARFMGMDNDSFFAALDADSHARRGVPLPSGFRARCHARYRELIETRLAEVPGALQTVAACPTPKAVASSSETAMLEIKLHKTGLWDHFAPHVYSAGHVARAKPAPDLFLHAAQGLGVAPAACLVLEDSANGVTGARAAGMTVWGFLGGGHMNEDAGARLLAAGASRLVSGWQEAGRLLGTALAVS
ncbi:MAG: HAD-IA family hydrolase [Alphaproteobacteria bacterium]|nr:HAD-IA family hydrolase [Alphaproteobacteria bacterium]